LKLVNIGAKDIHDAVSPKLILGLVWTLILRYQIQCGNDSPKQALLDWVNAQIKPYEKYGINQVTNFTKHWVDARVICALADSIQPGLMEKNVQSPGEPIPDWNEALQKSLEAFEIPPLVDADDCVNNPDEHSLMTYVSCFRDYLENKAKDSELYAPLTTSHSMDVPLTTSHSMDAPLTTSQSMDVPLTIFTTP
jgi:hypothetical protein